MKNNQVLYYVDDDGDDLMFFSEAANELGCSVKLFSNGEKLLSALKQNHEKPDIVFVDLNMPGKSGFEVIAEMRASEGLNTLPAIVLSTASDTFSIDKSRHTGANMFVQKPTTIDGLIDAIKNALARDWSIKAGSDFVFRHA